nr:MAG TPA: hypothetical protein [Caudoviricetes sp.]
MWKSMYTHLVPVTLNQKKIRNIHLPTINTVVGIFMFEILCNHWQTSPSAV